MIPSLPQRAGEVRVWGWREEGTLQSQGNTYSELRFKKPRILSCKLAAGLQWSCPEEPQEGVSLEEDGIPSPSARSRDSS